MNGRKTIKKLSEKQKNKILKNLSFLKELSGSKFNTEDNVSRIIIAVCPECKKERIICLSDFCLQTTIFCNNIKMFTNSQWRLA